MLYIYNIRIHNDDLITPFLPLVEGLTNVNVFISGKNTEEGIKSC